jgi:uncharacterized membrane protein
MKPLNLKEKATIIFVAGFLWGGFILDICYYFFDEKVTGIVLWNSLLTGIIACIFSIVTLYLIKFKGGKK